MSKHQRILDLLQAGHIIRVIDGRCGDGFVDKQALDELIRLKKVKVVKKQGMNFAKALPLGDTTFPEA